MDRIVTPGKLAGRVAVPSSKSMAHRYLLCAALAKGESRVDNVTFSDDIKATLNGVAALGAEFSVKDRTVSVTGGRPRAVRPEIDCGESGSTLRFLIPVALAAGEGRPVSFRGHGRLMERPLEPYFAIFREKGVRWNREGDLLTVEGRLPGGSYSLSGQVSSQFVTGLLLALSLLPEAAEIHITDGLQSRGYVDMTLDAMTAFGVKAENQGYRQFRLPGGQSFRAGCCAVEGDYSQAAFFLGANFLGSRVELLGMNPQSIQGDRTVVSVLEQMKAPGRCVVDAGEIPDLIPVLAVCAAGRNGGTTVFSNAARLRLKESDRLETTAALIRDLGGKVREGADFLEVDGTGGLSGGTADSCNDHRIAMAAAVAATVCRGPVRVLGAECVAKSYPDFWKDYEALGGIAAVSNG
ncbi:MAG: 3-phosphoshikimate 1-carboxyvinyltransferase [Candidatus Merdivicinus sp.]|jgi:3-phosphoshikimate 1-carboxyvinyltransferase